MGQWCDAPKFETDTDTAYQKAVPTGAKLDECEVCGWQEFCVESDVSRRSTYQGTECNCKPCVLLPINICAEYDCEAEQGTTVYMYFREVIYTKNNQTVKL
ncbi:MAG: hypothetical protein ACLTD2_05145 [Ruminococcus sp.]